MRDINEINLEHDVVVMARPKGNGTGVCRPYMDIELYLGVIGKDDGCYATGTLMKVPEGITEDELWEIAKANTMRNARTMSMPNFLGTTEPDDEEVFEETEIEIVINELEYKGAGAIILTDLFKAYCQKHHILECYVIPSSIHEVLLVRTIVGDADGINNIIRSINETEVAPADRLADHAYIYNAIRNEVRPC